MLCKLGNHSFLGFRFDLCNLGCLCTYHRAHFLHLFNTFFAILVWIIFNPWASLLGLVNSHRHLLYLHRDQIKANIDSTCITFRRSLTSLSAGLWHFYHLFSLGRGHWGFIIRIFFLKYVTEARNRWCRTRRDCYWSHSSWGSWLWVVWLGCCHPCMNFPSRYILNNLKLMDIYHSELDSVSIAMNILVSELSLMALFLFSEIYFPFFTCSWYLKLDSWMHLKEINWWEWFFMVLITSLIF